MCWNSGIDPTPCSGGAAAVEGRSRSRGQPSMIEGFPSPWCTQGVSVCSPSPLPGGGTRAGPCLLTCGVMSSRAALCRRPPDGALRIRSDQTAAQAPSRRPGAARSRSGRRATPHRSEPDHARLALRPERDSPRGGRRDGAYPAPPRCSCPSSTADHLGDLPGRRGSISSSRPMRLNDFCRAS